MFWIKEKLKEMIAQRIIKPLFEYFSNNGLSRHDSSKNGLVQTSANQSTNNSSQTNNPNTGDPRLNAIKQIFPGNRGEHKRVHFNPVDKDGTLDTSWEESRWENNHKITIENKTRTMNSNQEVVKIKDIKGKCSDKDCENNGYCSNVYFCQTCGIPLCSRHCFYMTTEEGKEKQLCLAHATENYYNWNVWVAYDMSQTGQRSLSAFFPPNPVPIVGLIKETS